MMGKLTDPLPSDFWWLVTGLVVGIAIGVVTFVALLFAMLEYL